MSGDQNQEMIELLKKSIAASDRTTHAVRAIVLPSTIILVTLLIVIPISLIGVVSQSGVPLVFSALILVVGGIMAISAQISETKSSEVPMDLGPAAPMKPEQIVVEKPSSVETSPQVESSEKKCRFCGKPFPPGYYDSCPDCGRN